MNTTMSHTRIPDDDRQMAFADMIEPKHKMRKSGLFPSEEAALKIFALSDVYPRQLTIERTGTVYMLHGPSGARGLLRALRFGSNDYRWNLTEGRSPTKAERKRGRRLF